MRYYNKTRYGITRDNKFLTTLNVHYVLNPNDASEPKSTYKFTRPKCTICRVLDKIKKNKFGFSVKRNNMPALVYKKIYDWRNLQ